MNRYLRPLLHPLTLTMLCLAALACAGGQFVSAADCGAVEQADQWLVPVSNDHPLRSLFDESAEIYQVPGDGGAPIAMPGIDDQIRTVNYEDLSAAEQQRALAWGPCCAIPYNCYTWPELQFTATGGSVNYFGRFYTATVSSSGTLIWKFKSGEWWVCCQPSFTNRIYHYVDEQFNWQDGYLADGNQSGTYIIRNALITNDYGQWTQTFNPTVAGTYTWNWINTHQDPNYHCDCGMFYSARFGSSCTCGIGKCYCNCAWYAPKVIVTP